MQKIFLFNFHILKYFLMNLDFFEVSVKFKQKFQLNFENLFIFKKVSWKMYAP